MVILLAWVRCEWVVSGCGYGVDRACVCWMERKVRISGGMRDYFVPLASGSYTE